MGLNIHIEDHGQCDDGYCRSTQPDWWDSGRCGGDRDFIVAEFEWVYLPSSHDEPGKRPVDFEQARAWVLDNIEESNRPRLLEALDKMEADPHLWLSGVW